MTADRLNRLSKTMRGLKVSEITFSSDNSASSEGRSLEVVNLVAQMILLAHKRGRMAKNQGESDGI